MGFLGLIICTKQSVPDIFIGIRYRHKDIGQNGAILGNCLVGTSVFKYNKYLK
jgi:hypothetical protein